MSLILLFQKIQTPEDYHAFLQITKQYIDTIYSHAPEDVKRIYQEMLWALFMNIKVLITFRSASNHLLIGCVRM